MKSGLFYSIDLSIKTLLTCHLTPKGKKKQQKKIIGTDHIQANNSVKKHLMIDSLI